MNTSSQDELHSLGHACTPTCTFSDPDCDAEWDLDTDKEQMTTEHTPQPTRDSLASRGQPLLLEGTICLALAVGLPQRGKVLAYYKGSRKRGLPVGVVERGTPTFAFSETLSYH